MLQGTPKEIGCPKTLFEWGSGHACALLLHVLSMGLKEIAEYSVWLAPSVPYTVKKAALHTYDHLSIQTGDQGPPFS